MKEVFVILAASVYFTFASCHNKCDNTLCKNGGTCNDGKCDCPPGFTGNLCEERICENGGTSINGNCACIPSFYGTNCEKSIIYGKKYRRYCSYMPYMASPVQTIWSGDTIQFDTYQYAPGGNSITFMSGKTFPLTYYNNFGISTQVFGGNIYATNGTISKDGNHIRFDIHQRDHHDIYTIGIMTLEAIQ